MSGYGGGYGGAATGDPISGSSQTNTLWTRPTTSTIKVEPRDTNFPAYVTVVDSGGTTANAIIPGAGLTWSIAIADDGALNGRRVAEAEDADLVHEIYIVTQADGLVPATLSEVSGVKLTHANLAIVDSEYTMLSIVSWAGTNQASDLVDFHDGGNGQCRYLDDGWGLILASGTDQDPTPCDATNHAPDAAISFLMYVRPWNSRTSGSSSLYMYCEEAGTTLAHSFSNLANSSGEHSNPDEQYWHPKIADLDDSIWFEWQSINNTGVSVTLMGWRIPR